MITGSVGSVTFGPRATRRLGATGSAPLRGRLSPSGDRRAGPTSRGLRDPWQVALFVEGGYNGRCSDHIERCVAADVQLSAPTAWADHFPFTLEVEDMFRLHGARRWEGIGSGAGSVLRTLRIQLVLDGRRPLISMSCVNGPSATRFSAHERRSRDKRDQAKSATMTGLRGSSPRAYS